VCLKNCKEQPFALSYLSNCLSVYLQGTTQLPLNGPSWNLIFEYISKICSENSSFIKMWQDYMKTNIHFWSYLLHYFTEWEMFQTKVVEKIKTHFVFKNFFLIVPFMRSCSTCQATNNIWCIHTACWIPMSKNTLRISNTYCFSYAKLVAQTHIKGPAEIPDGLATQLWVELLAWGICPWAPF
jgi:hypothetical protein